MFSSLLYKYDKYLAFDELKGFQCNWMGLKRWILNVSMEIADVCCIYT